MARPWLAAGWSAPPGVTAGVSLRAGGSSRGDFAGRNVGLAVGDDPTAVAANRAELLASIRPSRPPLWLQQVHGVAVVDADAVSVGAVPVADAAVTRTGRCLMIQTADCLPVLLTACDGRVQAAAHAGWRGLAAGVIDAVLEAMTVPGADVAAWIGPAIAAGNYEIDAPVRDAFLDRDPALAAGFRPTRPGHFACDLTAIATAQLQAAGVTDISTAGLCTFADAQRFYSYRRDGRTGRQASFIVADAAPDEP